MGHDRGSADGRVGRAAPAAESRAGFLEPSAAPAIAAASREADDVTNDSVIPMLALIAAVLLAPSASGSDALP